MDPRMLTHVAIRHCDGRNYPASAAAVAQSSAMALPNFHSECFKLRLETKSVLIIDVFIL
uniref:Uncharacterized protein n=1 Tax=Rhizophora mucronata TaxID=61149 RepID=A0A2P2J6U2_RHIMU